MNILFLSIGRVADINDKGIYTDLLREFVKNDHNIYIVSKIDKKLNLKTSLIQKNKVNYLKVRTGNFANVSRIEKGISTITLEREFLRAIKKYFSDVKFDLVLYSTPPITFAKVIDYIKKRDNAKTYLLLKDIFPQNAVDLQMMKKDNIIYKYFRMKEKKLYNNSDLIGCMSRGNREYLLAHNSEIESEKVEICPNSIDPVRLNIERIEKEKIREKYKIPVEKKVFIYGGNLGKPQGVSFLIECLKANQSNTHALFLILGSGTEVKRLRNFIENNNLKNVILMNHVPKDDYDKLVSSADVGLVFLDYRFSIPNIPSRMLPYMQASLPILAATDKSTDLKEIINEGKFGFWVPSNNVESFTEKVDLLLNEELRERMGKNSFSYLQENYNSRKSYDIIMDHFIN